MIYIIPTGPSTGADTINTTSQHPWLATSSFSLDDVSSGYINVYPTLLTNVLSSRLSTIPLQINDPTGNLLTISASFAVTWTYCPSITSTPIVLQTTNTSTPIVIGSSVLPLVEAHGLSTWDVDWQIGSVSGGRIEYYCPDANCNGPQWVPLSLPAQIKQVHRLYNCSRG